MAVDRSRRLAGKVLEVCRKAYGRNTPSRNGSALEELVLGIVQNESSEEKAWTTVKSLLRTFVDWNEIRVAAAHEIAAGMPGLPNALEKARIIRAVLGKVYARTNEMSIEYLRNRSQREALRLVAGIEGFPETALARAMLIGLDHAVLPLTPRLVLVCRRLGLVKSDADRKTMLGRIEKSVARTNMFEFHWLISRHAQAVCLPKEPMCAKCKLLRSCATGTRNAKTKRKSGGGRRPAARARARSRK